MAPARYDPVTSWLHVVDREDYEKQDMQGGNDSGSQFWTANGTKVQTNTQRYRTLGAACSIRNSQPFKDSW